MTKKLFIQTEQQRQWLGELATVAESFKARAQKVDEQATFPSENYRDLRNLGYMKITLPKEEGGDGFTLYDAILVHETLSSYCGSTGLAMAWTIQNVGELFENRYWPEEKLAQLAEAVKNGATINRAVSEFAMGSPVRGGRPATTAVRDGEQWVLTGRKNYTTGSPELDFFLVSAWVEEKEQVGFFLVPKEAIGLTIEETWDVISMRGTGSHDLVLDHVQVDASDLVELPNYNTGFKLNGWLLLIPATYLGIAQAARDYALEFANSHSPNSINGTIGQLPNVQSLIGEIELELAKARYTLYGVASLYERTTEKQLLVDEINLAKHTVTNAALTVVDKAMRIVGAKSLQRTNPLQRYYRDVRAGLHNPPMDDITIKKLAESALLDNKNDNYLKNLAD